MIRKGSQRVEVYNEGLIVYLYDPANADEIIAINPTSLLDCAIEPAKDKALKTCVEKGLIVAYELRQDDPIAVEVSVGEPLSKAEMKASKIPWMKPARTVINLKSGRLRIDTPNTFRIGGEARGCAEEYRKIHGKLPDDDDFGSWGLTDPGGEITVPKGDYVLTLHRVDFAKLDDDVEFDGPGEFISLTPAKKAERPRKMPLVIEFGSGIRVPGLRTFKISNNVFHGRTIGGNIVNMTAKHVAALGICIGQKLDVTVGDTKIEPVFIGCLNPATDDNLKRMLLGKKFDSLFTAKPPTIVASIHEHPFEDKIVTLHLETLDPGKPFYFEPGVDVVVRGLSQTAFEPAEAKSTAQEPKLIDEKLHGSVLLANDRGFQLDLGENGLKTFGLKEATHLNLRVGGAKLPLLFTASRADGNRPMHIIQKANRQPKDYNDIFSYMYQGGDPLFRTMIGPRSGELISKLQQWAKGCTFNTSDGYVPKDKKTAAVLERECVEIWNSGLDRWTGQDAVRGFAAIHWNGPPKRVLHVEPIAYGKKLKTVLKPGTPYVLERA